jgi:hypothetical protein
MKTRTIILHLVRIGGITTFLAICMLYPLVPLSAMTQALGSVGLLLLPIGVLWLVHELRKRARKARNLPYADRGHGFALASLITATIVAIVVSLVGLISAGFSVGCFTLGLWLYAVSTLMPGMKRLRKGESGGFNPVPIYLILIPAAVLLLQLILAAPATELSRNRAIKASAQLINEIERHRAAFGRYPGSLLAVNQDYHTSVVGIEKFHYAPNGNAYDLFFEQPRFVLDKIGTREFVVFNKLDEHLIPSHAAWILDWPPEQLSVRPGWYAVHDASNPHWKYFWFD